jgi:hypothetical protein
MGTFGTGPWTFALSTGSLPPGLTLSSSGLISGTPTYPAQYNFSVDITDSSGLVCPDVQLQILTVEIDDLSLLAGASICNAFGGQYNVAVSGPISLSVTGDAADCYSCFYSPNPPWNGLPVYDGAVYTITVQAITGDPDGWVLSCIGFNTPSGYSASVNPSMTINHFSNRKSPGDPPDVFTITFAKNP